MQKERVVIAMSGGVDSCVAAALLLEQGYDVIGITMQLWDHSKGGEQRFDSCCSLTDVHDARRVAHRLGIPHYLVNYESEFKAGVVDYFAAEYANGRTPNPCVMCNSKLKFDHLVARAKALGATKVATGHYAQVETLPDGELVLRRGVDQRKDQSYFLFDVKREYLETMLFPLGGLTKPEVRAIAEKLGFHTAKKHESQEICFVSGKRYTDFLAEHYPETTTITGPIVNRAGKVLGQHEGIHLFTVGQRKGLGNLGVLTPLYVRDIDAKTGTVFVDDADGLRVETFIVGKVNWLNGKGVANGTLLSVVPRYRARPLPCRVTAYSEGPSGQRVQVDLFEAAPWVTPGQAAVFYDEDRVIGGGFIDARKHEGSRTATAEAALRA
jgi:tRNA-specific 2-thiouridylase